MEETVLNRLSITGTLDETTPICVVKEILQAHNLSTNKIDDKSITFSQLQNEINKLNSYRPITLYGDIKENIRYIAAFVNHECKTWSQRSLLKSYEHLLNFPKDDPSILSNITYSQKDRDNTDGYNACMLYALCKRYNIETSWKTNPNQMADLLRKLSTDTTKLRMGLIPLIESLTKTQLVNIYALLEKNSKKDIQLLPINDKFNKTKNIEDVKPMICLDQSKLQQYYDKFNDRVYLLSNLQPTNHYEAIVLAGLLFNLNIIESRFPLLEYEELSETRNLDMYVPIDSIFRKRYLINKQWYLLNHHWCPELSFLYSSKDIKNFCSQEGYVTEDFRNYDELSLLHMSRISINIYIGKNIYEESEDVLYTPINMDTISDLNNNECITIGIINEPSTLKTYSIQELCDLFTNVKNYINPENSKEMLPGRIVNKLHHFASKYALGNLCKAISVVEKWKQYSNEFSESLRLIYSENNKIVEYLYKILEAGMYMRGWKVISDKYPIKEEETKLMNPELQFEIEKQVHSSIQEIQTYIESESLSEEERNVLKTLPLMKFSHEGDTKIFVLTPDPDDGSSMLNRLQIVLDGNKHKNMKSCIRLSSNILLHSIYFYLCSLGLPEPYNIFELEHIT